MNIVDQQAEQLIRAQAGEQEQEFWRFLGALGFAERLTISLSAQTLHALNHIKLNKTYLRGGYQTFDDFLDHDPHSPMKSEAFRRRWNLLQGEGDETFNLLNSLKVPLETRKLLAGEIEITDDGIKIGGVETKLNDNDRIVELISKLHGKTLEQQRTIERKDRKLEQGEKDFEALKRRAIMANPDGTETGQAILTAAGSLARLREILEAAPDEEKLAVRESIFSLLSNSQLELSVALGIVTRAEVSEAKGQGDDDDEAMRLMEEL
jgi:hypothetical protein